MPTLFEGLYTYFVLTVTPGLGMLQMMRRLRELKDTQLAFGCPGLCREQCTQCLGFMRYSNVGPVIHPHEAGNLSCEVDF